ncbi:hypothetical protein F5141DRAFT_3297 [Pisolithus sp. B1]|nr:hypothetical protein F5141DRAFT_3297 [Pisolithus sp. B1]
MRSMEAIIPSKWMWPTYGTPIASAVFAEMRTLRGANLTYSGHRSRLGRAFYGSTDGCCWTCQSHTGIAEGCGTKDKRCLVIWAFANGFKEAARVLRCFGEEACARALRGASVLWGEREWLEEEEMEAEADLAEVEGMNAFAAYVMLYGRTVEDVLDMTSESRMEEFGGLVGKECVHLQTGRIIASTSYSF